MKKLAVEGRILSIGRGVYDPQPKVVIGIPVPVSDEDDEDEERVLEFELDEKHARIFAPHLFDRVRVTFTVIPTPQLIHGQEESEEAEEGALCSSRNSGGLQNDDEAG